MSNYIEEIDAKKDAKLEKLLEIRKQVFIKRIKALRKKTGLHQKQIAKEMGLSTGYYGNIESGITFPSTKSLIKIQNYYDVSFDYLLNETSYPDKYEFPKILLQDDIIDIIKSIENIKIDGHVIKDKDRFIKSLLNLKEILKLYQKGF